MMNPMLFAGLYEQNQLMYRHNRKLCEFDTIINATAEVLKVDRELMLSRLKKRPIADARCIAIGLIIQVNPRITLEKIGEVFGKHHSTIIYNRDLFRDLYKRDKQFTEKVNLVKKRV